MTFDEIKIIQDNHFINKMKNNNDYQTIKKVQKNNILYIFSTVTVKHKFSFSFRNTRIFHD